MLVGLIWIWVAWSTALGAPVAADTPAPDPTETEEAGPLRVAVSPFAPFVSVDGPEPLGFSIDLWEALANEEGLTYQYATYANVSEKLAAVRNGDADIAIGGISVTLEREQQLDFTLATFRTGLDILIRDEQSSAFSIHALRQAATPGRVGIIIGFFTLIVVSGHLVWLAERGRDAFDDRYIPGVFEGMYWAIVTASTVGYGDKAPVRWAGRLVAALVIVVSLPMFAVFTAELTSTLTISTLRSSIESPADLRGRSVGVVAGTTGEAAVRQLGATVLPFDSPQDAVEALVDKDVDAVVHDAPNLETLARASSDTPLRTVGRLFEPQRYGIAVGQGADHRETINRALLQITEAGQWEAIRTRWFDGDLGK